MTAEQFLRQSGQLDPLPTLLFIMQRFIVWIEEGGKRKGLAGQTTSYLFSKFLLYIPSTFKVAFVSNDDYTNILQAILQK